MQSRNPRSKRNPYVKSGIAGKDAPGGRKRSPTKRIVKTVLLLCIVLAVVVGAVVGVRAIFGSTSEVVRINASPSDNIQALGANVLYYDGMTLHCVSNQGNTRWQFTLGAGANYRVGGDKVIAWTGQQVYVLDKNGVCSFNDRMTSEVLFGSIGASYIAVALTGSSETEASLLVMDHNGERLETLAISDLYLMDAGFFSTNDSLMWVLSLDVAGNAPISNLATYEPGRMSTGALELSDQLVYRVYSHNNNLMLVDTSTIGVYNYKCVEQTDIGSILVYGWLMSDLRAEKRNTYALFEPMPDSGASSAFSELRLITNYSSKSLRLLSPCFASGLGDSGVYGFGENVIYYCPYGEKTFSAKYLTFRLTDFYCMLEGNRGVFATGNDVFILKLPK